MINKSFSSLSKEDILKSIYKKDNTCPVYNEVLRLVKIYSDLIKPYVDRNPRLLDTLLNFDVNTDIEKIAISQCYKYIDSQVNDNEHSNCININ